jgi:hypothetical protein
VTDRPRLRQACSVETRGAAPHWRCAAQCAHVSHYAGRRRGGVVRACQSCGSSDPGVRLPPVVVCLPPVGLRLPVGVAPCRRARRGRARAAACTAHAGEHRAARRGARMLAAHQRCAASLFRDTGRIHSRTHSQDGDTAVQQDTRQDTLCTTRSRHAACPAVWRRPDTPLTPAAPAGCRCRLPTPWVPVARACGSESSRSESVAVLSIHPGRMAVVRGAA